MDESRQHGENSRLDLDSVSQLIARAKTGDDDAQNQLLAEMQEYVSLMANRQMDWSIQDKFGPSDVVQQSLVRVVENIDKFRGGSEAEFKGWLRKIVANEMNKNQRTFFADKRKAGRERALAADSVLRDGIHDDNHPTPSTQAMSAERIDEFYSVLQRLPEDYARVITLRSLQQMSFKQLAEEMGRSHDSVTKLWYRAMLKLEEEISQSEKQRGNHSD